jgi:hypothetical protein
MQYPSNLLVRVGSKESQACFGCCGASILLLKLDDLESLAGFRGGTGGGGLSVSFQVISSNEVFQGTKYSPPPSQR